MRERSSVTFNLACAFAVISTAALAYGIASRPAARERGPEAAVRAETIVVRSDKDRNVAAVKLRVAEESAAADRALFMPQPMYAQVAARPNAVPVVARAQPAPVVAAAPARRPAQVQLASIAAKPAVPAHSLTRPGAVLNDAQIASIKRRLNLTPSQERMWPSVEAALRNLSYAKNGQGPQKGARDAVQAVASIDPDAADVQNLKSAAIPLIMSFSDDQMRELQSISRVAGLDKLVPKF
jgi:hypothetical protein